MHYYLRNIIHMNAVTVQVQFSQAIVRARVIKDTHCAHLVAHYQLVRTQSTQSCDFVLAAVGVVDALCAGRKTEGLLLPLDAHLHENSIDAPVVLLEADHAYLLVAVLEQ